MADLEEHPQNIKSKKKVSSAAASKVKRTPKGKKSTGYIRNRTPSGQFITPKVSSIIKQYFDHTKSKKCTSVSQQDLKEVAQNLSRTNAFHVEHAEETDNAFALHASLITGINKPLNMMSVNINENSDSNCDYPTPSRIVQQTLDEHINKFQNANKQIDVDMEIERKDTEADSEAPNPAMISVVTVAKLLKDLKVDLTAKVESLMENYAKSKITTGTSKDEIDAALQYQERTITEIQGEGKAVKNKTKILAGTSVKMSDMIQELQQKVERLELSNAKKMFTLSSFPCSDKKRIYKRQLEAFISEEMGLEVDIEDIYKMGSKKPELLVVTVSSSDVKKKIFANIYKIKDLVNKDGKKFFFRSFTPSATMERRKREQDIVEENESLPDLKKRNIVYGKNGMSIDGEPYRKKIHVPDPAKIIQMEDKLICEIMEAHAVKGQKVIKSGSEFVPYTASVCSFEEINKVYGKVKLENPGARHVVAVWCIPGKNTYFTQDFQEDQEYGIGRRALKIMLENNLNNRAFFIARYYGGEKMHEDRFKCYLQAMKNALDKQPQNTITKASQSITVESISSVMQASNATNVAKLQSVRSGGRGGRSRGRGGYRGNRKGAWQTGTPYRSPTNNQEDNPKPPKRTYEPRTEEDIMDIDDDKITKVKDYFNFSYPGVVSENL